jgi:IS30 family transposase
MVDAELIVRTCEGCQYYARQIHMPVQVLQTIPISWPFMVWGLDLVGPFKKALGGNIHLLVVVDKLTKWIEAKPITKLKSSKATIFFRDIVYRFKVPNSIITDNGTQFTREPFLQFHDDFNIRVDWAVVAHPKSNGQVEWVNDLIL